jgi:hypothetical protein
MGYDRTVRLVVGFVLLAWGCYTPSFRDCMFQCAPGNVCPTGFECVDNTCRERGATGSCSGDAAIDSPTSDAIVDGNPNEDTDGDSFNDAVDNCRFMPNMDQANEDMDAFGDVCDPCPPRGGIDNLDGDGDGVGDGCDPFPNQPGERLRMFQGFGSTPVDVMHMGQSNAWVYNGRATVTTTADTLAVALWDLASLPTRRFYVSSHMEILGFRPSNMPRGAGVVDAYNIGTNASAACVLGLDPAGAPNLMLLETSPTTDLIVTKDPDNAGLGMNMMSPIAVNEAAKSGYACSSGTSNITGTPTSGGTRVGLRARSITAAFDWLMVIDSPR